MRIQSTRFGELDISDESLLQFPQGLPGFSNEKRFAFLPAGDESPFYFLQSTADANLAFVLVDPFLFFPEYEFELAEQVAQDMKLQQDKPPQIYTIVTIRDALASATANLLAPVIVNWADQTAAQLVLEKTSYTTRHALFPNGLPKEAVVKGGK